MSSQLVNINTHCLTLHKQNDWIRQQDNTRKKNPIQKKHEWKYQTQLNCLARNFDDLRNCGVNGFWTFLYFDTANINLFNQPAHIGQYCFVTAEPNHNYLLLKYRIQLNIAFISQCQSNYSHSELCLRNF